MRRSALAGVQVLGLPSTVRATGRPSHACQVAAISRHASTLSATSWPGFPRSPALGGVAGSGLAVRGVAGSGLAVRGVAGSGEGESGVEGTGVEVGGGGGWGLELGG